MRIDAITIEEKRIAPVENVSEYSTVRERHRIFPGVFENRHHKRIIDISAGVGIVGKNIKDKYSSNIICNDISPSCLRLLKSQQLTAISFDIDQPEISFPFKDGIFDAVITLATIEHILNTDRFIREIHRILNDDGYLYISAPNYSGILYLLPFLFTGRTFHDPLAEASRYEFYAHIRYFTYKTLIELLSSFGFVVDSVYVALPEKSSKFLALKRKSQVKANAFRLIMYSIYFLLGPRWASEPVVCLSKGKANGNGIRLKIL